MKETSKQQTTYTYSEILKSIEEGINLWDFAIKFGISKLERAYVLEILLLCTNNDKKKVNQLFETITLNSKEYIAQNNVKRKQALNYNTLLYLSKAGYSRIDIMKMFGRTSYQALNETIKKIFEKENISKELQTNIRAMIKKNSKVPKLKFVPDSLDDIKEVDVNAEDIIDKEEALPASPEVLLSPINVSKTTKLNKKLILYTIEYLKKQEYILDKVFDNKINEHVILSGTLSAFMQSNKVSAKSKIRLTESLNAEKVRVLIANSVYKQSNTKQISAENDIVLSQALKLSEQTTKKIYIATCDPQTALNALVLGFGIRAPKSLVAKKFTYITKEKYDEFPDYFDYEVSKDNVFPESCKEDSVVILDTCVIINNKNNTQREKILADTTQVKILPRIVMDELTLPPVFFSTLFAAKCNPTIIIDLMTILNYNYNDMAILNFAMLYKKNTGKDVTVFTCDLEFSIESLNYNMKTKYDPSTYMSTFETQDEEEKDITLDCEEIKPKETLEAEIKEELLIEDEEKLESETLLKIDEAEEITEDDDELEEEITMAPTYYQTVVIHWVSSKPVILKHSKITSVKSAKTRSTISLRGKKGQQYYPVELGDFVSFRNDPNLYELIELRGKNNLMSVELI